MPRVNAYLLQAKANLDMYHKMPREPNTKHAWSALYKALTALLGDELTHQLRKTHELTQDFVYIGKKYGDEDGTTIDHVIPLKRVIERLIHCSKGWPVGPDGIVCFRQFMIDHLVIAKIPKTLNAMLAPSAMPTDDWWKPIGPGFKEKKKQAALWGRYTADRIGVAIPNGSRKKSDFQLREKPAPRKRKVPSRPK